MTIAVIIIVLLNIFSYGENVIADSGDYIHYRLGVKYKNEKRYDDAVEEFRKVLTAYPDNYNAYINIAEIMMIKGKADLAAFNLKKALKYNPGWAAAKKMLADAYLKDGQYQSAINEFQSYMASCDPVERDSIQKIVNRLLSKPGVVNVHETNDKKNENLSTKKTSEPVKIAGKLTEDRLNKQIIINRSGNSEADTLFKKAIDLYENKKFNDAIEVLKKVRVLVPDFAGVYYYAGVIRRLGGQNSMAKINFNKAVNYQELGVNAYFYLGKIYGEEQQYDNAISNLKVYIAKTSDEQGKKEARILISEYEKKSGKAVSSKEPLIDSNATNRLELSVKDTSTVKDKYGPSIEVQIDSLLSMLTVDTLTDVGQKLLSGIYEFSNGNYDKAIKEFKKIAATNPNPVVTLNCIYNTGICYYKLRLYKDAENQFQQIIEKYPGKSVAAQSLFLKGCSYLERHESQSAEKVFREFLQKYRNHEWAGLAYEKLGDAYLDMEQVKNAIEAYSQAIVKITKPNDNTRVNFKLGNACLLTGNNQKAHEAFTSAINTGEKNKTYFRVPDSYYRIADEKYKQKEYKDALDFYQRVTRKYPAYIETPWGLFQIGTIYKNTKHYQEAITVFKDLIKKYPDDYWAKQAQWKMEDAIWENEYKSVLQ
jgi:tetratricopeptide (TPR) repeat protein